MKQTLLPVWLLALLVTFHHSRAQNPYQSLGVEEQAVTLSKGRYVEFFPNDTLVQIGSVLLNTVTGKVVAFVKTDTLYSEATLQPQLTSRWWSPDPLAEKYKEWSPYNYVLNNPIILVDPDGKAPKWIPGTDGKLVTYSKDSNGKVNWSANATADTRRIGNALLTTRTGEQQLNKLINSDTKIELKISGQNTIRTNPSGNKSYKTGGTLVTAYEKQKDGSYTAKEATLTIYEKTLQTFLGLNTNNQEQNAYKNSVNNIDEAIGAVAGHESVHAADKTNVNQNLSNQLDGSIYDVEAKPEKVEHQILKELYDNNHPIQPIAPLKITPLK